MLFQKLLIPVCPGEKQPVENWYLILRSAKDVLDYMEIDASLIAQAYVSIPASLQRSHLEGSREQVVHMMLCARANRLKENETISPAEVIGELVGGKTKNMLDMIERGEYVLVQQSGGYCDYSGFIKIWDAQVIEEIEQDGCYFPQPVPVETDLLFIENAERVPVDFERQIKNLVGFYYNQYETINSNLKSGSAPLAQQRASQKNKKLCAKINMLKLREPKYVAGMIAKAKIIAVQTQVVDKIQFDKFMQLFSTLSGKIIYISTGYSEDIMNHPLYGACAVKHQINFVN